MSESRRSSGHRSPLTAIEWLQRQSAQNTSDPRTPMSRISAKVIFWGRAPEENVIRSLPKRSNEARTDEQRRANSLHTVETVTRTNVDHRSCADGVRHDRRIDGVSMTSAAGPP